MSKAIKFRFEDRKSAYLALDTLVELGYRAHMGGNDDVPELHLEVDHNDLTSALEVMQACGGTLLEESGEPAHDAFNRAYDLDAVPIPAHLVNEDWPENCLQPDDRAAGGEKRRENDAIPGLRAKVDEDFADPADETYDHFSADVRL